MVTGILHYELFGYLSILSSGFFSQEYYDSAAAIIATDAALMEKNFRYFYFAQGTKYDLTYESGMQALKLFRDNGLTVHYWEYPGGHQWEVWKQDFRTFTKYIFRDTTTRYISLAFQGGNIRNSTVMTYRDSLAPEPDAPTRAGHTFAGWYRQPEYIDSFNFSTDTIRNNLTIYADWSINSYEVDFNPNGGNYTPESIVVDYNSLIEEPDSPQKPDFEFEGWYADEGLTKKWNFSSSRVTKDTTLYANWITSSALGRNYLQTVYLFPNPAQTQLRLANLPGNASVEIINPEGRVLIKKNSINNDGIIDIHMLPQGIYTVVVYCSTGNYHLPLVKE